MIVRFNPAKELLYTKEQHSVVKRFWDWMNLNRDKFARLTSPRLTFKEGVMYELIKYHSDLINFDCSDYNIYVYYSDKLKTSYLFISDLTILMKD